MTERRHCGKIVPSCLPWCGPEGDGCSYCAARRPDFAMGTSWRPGKVAAWRAVQKVLSGVVETERDPAGC